MLLAIAAQAVYYYPQLPEQVATHFGVDGVADDWSSKNAFFVGEGVAVVLMMLTFLVMPRFLRLMPDSLVNLPNKAYWLAPSRREATLQKMEDGMIWCGVATLGLMLVIFQWAIQANLQPPQQIPAGSLWLLLAAYSGVLMVWVVRFCRSFRLPAGEIAAS
ncbi:MAG: DUF1648 domain-containing protein [Acidobacteriota bacterium]